MATYLVLVLWLLSPGIWQFATWQLGWGWRRPPTWLWKAPVESLFEVATLRRLMIAKGITEAATVARSLRIRPLELEDSREVRLERLIPQAQYKHSSRTLLVPEAVVPQQDVVPWVTKLLEQLT